MREHEFGPVEEMGLEWKVHIWKWWHPTVKEKALRGWTPTKEELKRCTPDPLDKRWATPIQHQKFLEDLEFSEAGRKLIALELRRQGWDISAPPMTKAPTHQEAHLHSDRGDLFLLDQGDEIAQIECHRLRYHFTNELDWKFRNAGKDGQGEFMVGPVHRIDRAKNLLCYLTLNEDMKNLAVSIIKVVEQVWWEDTRPTGPYGFPQTNYICPPDAVIWLPLGADLTFLKTFL